MSTAQFLGLVCIIVLAVVTSVELAIRVRWRTIEAMFGRALMHGGSLDTLSRRLKQDSQETKDLASGAVEVSRAFKGRLDDHEGRLKKIEDHPIFRPLGGPGTLEGL